jgi:capsular polysaccharide transport system permease protein
MNPGPVPLINKYLKQILLLILPFFLFLVYIGFFAVEKYRSESIYVIRDLSTKEDLGIDLGIFSAGTTGKKLDAVIVVHFLQSADMFNRVDAEFNLKDRYQSEKTDILERLIWDPAQEDFVSLYRKNLKIVPDEVSGITKISFAGTDARRAQEILQFLLNQGEVFLNRLNHETVEKKSSFLSQQLAENKKKLETAIQLLEAFQNKHRVIDPSTAVAAYQNIIAEIQADIVRKTAEYNQLRRYMSEDTIEVIQLKNEIEEHEVSLEKLKDWLSGPDKQHLNDLIFEYQRLQADVDFNKQVYEKTLVQHELNKMEALQESKVFEVIAAPTLPDGHVYPRRIYMTLTAVILLLIGYKIISLIWAVVQDHKD